MKIAMAQMSMGENMDKNFQKSLELLKKAAEGGADLILYPEIQLCRFFPQYEDMDVSSYVLDENSEYFKKFAECCKTDNIMASPNFYFRENGRLYDMSFLISAGGEIIGRQKMVHIAQAEGFYEQSYYTPSEEGFQVFGTPFGRIGIVVCFDRHYPESIRTSALKGADMVLIPTANTADEPMEMFEWEIRVQSFQSSVAIAMCNRVGLEDKMDFCGESLVTDADGNVIAKGGSGEELIFAEIDLQKVREVRASKNYTNLRRKNLYF